MQWERKIIGRPGQAHVFIEEPNGNKRSLCGTINDPTPCEWAVADKGMKCATCRRVVDPDNAPKAPKWRER